MRDTARQYVQYHQRVLATNPIAYWMLDEKSGAVAYDWVSGRVVGAANGAHTGVTLGQDGIGDGCTSPLYNGANGYTNIQTAALATTFNGSEGTVNIWGRVSAVGVWTDGARRDLFLSRVDANNIVILNKDTVNNQLRWYFASGGAAKSRTRAAMTTTDFFMMSITWSDSGDEVKAYYNGVQEGATFNAVGLWVGAVNNSVIGASDLILSNLWSGTLAHCALWSYPLSADRLQQFYRARRG